MRAINTMAEVDALNPASVVRDVRGFVYERGVRRTDFEVMGREDMVRPSDIELPAVVLWESVP